MKFHFRFLVYCHSKTDISTRQWEKKRKRTPNLAQNWASSTFHARLIYLHFSQGGWIDSFRRGGLVIHVSSSSPRKGQLAAWGQFTWPRRMGPTTAMVRRSGFSSWRREREIDKEEEFRQILLRATYKARSGQTSGFGKTHSSGSLELTLWPTHLPKGLPSRS